MLASSTRDSTPDGSDHVTLSVLVAWSKVTPCKIGGAAELAPGIAAQTAATRAATHKTVLTLASQRLRTTRILAALPASCQLQLEASSSGTARSRLDERPPPEELRDDQGDALTVDGYASLDRGIPPG
jgi:hypothetical protein